MFYNFNGKNLNIPDAEIEKSMKLFKISKDEAIEMWLDDEGYTENEEVEILTKKAKDNKTVQHGAKADSGKTKKASKREPKIDLEKESIIVKIAEFLATTEAEMVEITNKSKIIEFNVGENHYKLDLIKQRKPKN